MKEENNDSEKSFSYEGTEPDAARNCHFLVLISHYAVWIGEIFHSDLLEYGLGRFGVYGVDLFLWCPATGWSKVLEKENQRNILWKRFKTVYLPYLLIVGLIAVYDGGISGMTGWVSFLTGAEYWYIRNILIFYLAFYVVYRLSDRSWVRMLLMALCLTAYSGLLIWQGRALFWYISNVTFCLECCLRSTKGSC